MKMNLYKLPRGQIELFAKDMRYGINVSKDVSYRPDLLVNKYDNMTNIKRDSEYMNFSNTSALRMNPNEMVIIPSNRFLEMFGKKI